MAAQFYAVKVGIKSVDRALLILLKSTEKNHVKHQKKDMYYVVCI